MCRIKSVNILLNRVNVIVEMQKLNQIHLIMQQKQEQQVLMYLIQQQYQIYLLRKHDKLVINVSAIDTIVFVLQTQYNTNKSSLEKKIDDAGISDTSGLIKKWDYASKFTDIEGKILRITSCAYTAALNAVKNKMIWSGKQIMMKNYQALRLNISPHLVLINLQVKVRKFKDKRKRVS